MLRVTAGSLSSLVSLAHSLTLCNLVHLCSARSLIMESFKHDSFWHTLHQSNWMITFEKMLYFLSFSSLWAFLIISGLFWRWRWEGIHLQGAQIHPVVRDISEAPQALLREVWTGECEDDPGLWKGKTLLLPHACLISVRFIHSSSCPPCRSTPKTWTQSMRIYK